MHVSMEIGYQVMDPDDVATAQTAARDRPLSTLGEVAESAEVSQERINSVYGFTDELQGAHDVLGVDSAVQGYVKLDPAQDDGATAASRTPASIMDADGGDDAGPEYATGAVSRPGFSTSSAAPPGQDDNDFDGFGSDENV